VRLWRVGAMFRGEGSEPVREEKLLGHRLEAAIVGTRYRDCRARAELRLTRDQYARPRKVR
jgi:hypothetical protein